MVNDSVLSWTESGWRSNWLGMWKLKFRGCLFLGSYCVGGVVSKHLPIPFILIPPNTSEVGEAGGIVSVIN